jgi:hypothetical protein
MLPIGIRPAADQEGISLLGLKHVNTYFVRHVFLPNHP